MSQNQKKNQPGPEIDPELVDLLDQINDESKTPIKKPKIVDAKIESKEQQKDEKQVVETTLVSNEMKALKETNDEDIPSGIRNRVLDINMDVLDSCDADRQQIQNTINLLYDKVQYDDNANRAYVEQLVNALRAKAEINDTAVRASETLVKLINATKKKEVATKNTVNITPDSLKQLLKDE